MTTTETRPEATTGQDRPPVAAGDLVITWWDAEPVEYGGPGDRGAFTTLSFGLHSGRTPVRTCDLTRVAPAGTPIPSQDARVTITQRPRTERPPGAPGNWRLDLPGQASSWHRTKRDGTADGLRQLAILDWHVAQAAAAAATRITSARLQPVPDLAPGVPSEQNAVTAALDDGTEAELFRYYTAELRFGPDEFAGLTVAEAQALFARKDAEYLRS